MSDWTAGYVAEIGYTYGYYRELSPGILALAALNKGVRFDANRPLRYLELGFGQGVSINMHAAACAGEFWGTDFNPAQAAHAKELSAASGSQAKLYDAAFAELAARDDLPEFDIIALHGIWTWISPENRHIIIDIARRRLATGGLFYVSYNCTPGWAPAMPLRHLMKLYGERACAPDMPITSRLDGAIEFAQKVVDSGALYFKANPQVGERLKKIKDQGRNYLAHEYFTHDWHVMPFSDVAEHLSAAKLEYCASANLMEHVDAITISAEGKKVLEPISNVVLRESVRDYLMNVQFRKDIFVKGAVRLRGPEQLELYRAQSFALSSHPDDVPLKMTGPIGEVNLNAEIYKPIIAALAEKDYAAKTVAEIQLNSAVKGQGLGQILQALIVLTGSGHVHPAQDAAAIKTARPRCKALNAHLCQKARFSADVSVLASPVIGGGVNVGRFQQIFLYARAHGKTGAKAWAEYTLECLKAGGERLLKEGKPVEKPEDALAEVVSQAEQFEAKRLPILKALGVAT